VRIFYHDDDVPIIILVFWTWEASAPLFWYDFALLEVTFFLAHLGRFSVNPTCDLSGRWNPSPVVIFQGPGLALLEVVEPTSVQPFVL
jgi:hypothetical protein